MTACASCGNRDSLEIERGKRMRGRTEIFADDRKAGMAFSTHRNTAASEQSGKLLTHLMTSLRYQSVVSGGRFRAVVSGMIHEMIPEMVREMDLGSQSERHADLRSALWP